MKWIYSESDPILQTLGGCIILFVVIIILTRIMGLRSFAKFTVYDFAFTVAIGSIISSILTSSTSIVQGSVAIAGLLVITYFASMFRRKSEWFESITSNSPLLLMDGKNILHQNLKKARLQESQLTAKLREANVLNLDQVKAVVLESTGDISVLHASDDDEAFDEELLLRGVKR